MFLKLPYAYSVDWWALGVVLYECTYNTHPFHCFKKIPIEAAIQRCEIKIPAAIDVHVGKFSFEFDIDQQNFIKGLLEKKIDDRLGCGPGGFVSQIQSHDWFGSIDWELLYLRKIVPEFVPNVTNFN